MRKLIGITMLFQKHLWSLVRASLWSKPGCRHASLLVLPDYYAHRPSASQSCLGQDLYQVSFTPNRIKFQSAPSFLIRVAIGLPPVAT